MSSAPRRPGSIPPLGLGETGRRRRGYDGDDIFLQEMGLQGWDMVPFKYPLGEGGPEGRHVVLSMGHPHSLHHHRNKHLPSEKH